MPVTVFHKDEVVAHGMPGELPVELRSFSNLTRSSDLLAFDDETGKQVDLDLILAPAPRPRGRPALGVEAREVTLLPRHWEWLGKQPGGASVSLRKLVEAALRAGRSERECQDAAFEFLRVIAGDLPGYEEAIRSLYAGDRLGFDNRTDGWPPAVRDHAVKLAWSR